jgi:hypothetical protein
LEDLESQGLAMGYYRLGLTSIGLQDPVKAKNYFERCELIRELALRQKLDNKDVKQNPELAITQRLDLMLAQARSGNVKPAIEEAYRIMESLGSEDRLKTDPNSYLQHAAYALSIASEQVAGPEKAKWMTDALSVMKTCFQYKLVDNDFLAVDPDVAPLRAIPEFQSMMEANGIVK